MDASDEGGRARRRAITRGAVPIAVAWAALGAVLLAVTAPLDTGRTFAGLGAPAWVAIAWTLALAHHAWIFAFWRLELYAGKSSEWFGRERGFRVFQAGFLILGPARMLLVGPISCASAGALSVPPALAIGYAIATSALCLWAGDSLVRYFGLRRACGADHFFDEYRRMPLETRGVHRFSPNAFYVFVLPALYQPGLLFGSALGLAVAGAQHAMVWIAYYAAERRDMDVLARDRVVA